MDAAEFQQLMANNQAVSSLGVPQYGFGNVLSAPGIGFQGLGGGSESGGSGGDSNSGGSGMGNDLLSMLLGGPSPQAAQGALGMSNQQDYFNPQSLSPAMQGGTPQGNGYVKGGHWNQNLGPSSFGGKTMPTDMMNQLNMAQQMGNMRIGQLKQVTPLLAGLFGGGGGGGFSTNFGQSASIGQPAHA